MFLYCNSVKSLFGGGKAGRTRLFQTADVAVLLLNYAMKLDSPTEGMNEGQLAGQCRGSFYSPELEDDNSRFVVLSTVFGNSYIHLLWRNIWSRCIPIE